MSTNASQPTGGFAFLAIDAALAAGLAVALLMVFGLEGISPPGESSEPTTTIEEVAQESPPAARPLRLGVTPSDPEFDDMGSLLRTLGDGYKFEAFDLDGLLDPQKLEDFDVIFLTCSGFPSNWLGQQTGNSLRGGGLYAPNPEVFARARESLRKFVGKGGTLYVSDLHFTTLDECFPEAIDRSAVNLGAAQSLVAEVVDPGLREIIGSQIDLRFDQPSWRPAAFRSEESKTYLRGEFQTQLGATATAPLLVKFPFQEGNVIFTSFHNEKQNSEIETKLLRYLVFTAVTASVDSQVSKTMLRGGFAPTKQNLFSTSPGTRSVTQTYQCNEEVDLQFVLGFVEQGARLKLTVTGPDGTTKEREGTSTVTIEVLKASKGVWKYTVTALSVPNENFPFTVNIGQK